MALLTCLCLLLGLTGCGSQGTPAGAQVGRGGLYDYTPSVIRTGSLQQFWWCGQAQNPADPSQSSDTILYESKDLTTGAQEGPQVVLAETPGTWDSAYTCNPRVIRGVFTNPLGNGQTYTYELFYVGTNNIGGSDNGIGAAFSNDGILWTKYPTPVIGQTNPNGFGPAQPVAYNRDGKQGITLFFEDDTPPAPANHHVQATSTDGVHFTDVGLLTTNGLSYPTHDEAWADMVYNQNDGFWYAIYNLLTRAPSTTDNIVEHGQLGYQIYRIPQNDLLTGNTGWQEMKTVDTSLTGYESNFLPGILGDGYGNLYQDGSGAMQIYPSFSNVHLYWNTTPGDAAFSSIPANWDIGLLTWSPTSTTPYTLTRWFNGSAYVTTTGWIDQTVSWQATTLGQMYPAPQTGATTSLWSCKASGTDQYVSLDSSCAGQYVSGFLGYIYGAKPAGTPVVPIYLCLSTNGHFVSNDAACEGGQTMELLGYILPPATTGGTAAASSRAAGTPKPLR